MSYCHYSCSQLDHAHDASASVQLVLINISDHAMRAKQVQQQSAFPRIIGCLLGSHAGRNIEIINSFEMVERARDNGEAAFDAETFNQKLEQYQEVFKSLELIGWYATGAGLQASDLSVHRQLTEHCEAPILLSMDPHAATQVGAKELPLALYESGAQVTTSRCASLLACLPASMPCHLALEYHAIMCKCAQCHVPSCMKHCGLCRYLAGALLTSHDCSI